jgi:hypothetical protein
VKKKASDSKEIKALRKKAEKTLSKKDSAPRHLLYGPEQREINMLIKVMYQDEKIAEIEAYQLEDLIRSNKIKKFVRSGRWVTIGIDPIRKTREDYLEMPKRRKCNKKTQKRK